MFTILRWWLKMAADTGSAYDYGLEHDRKIVPTTNLHIFSTLFMMITCPTLRRYWVCAKFIMAAGTGNGYNYGLEHDMNVILTTGQNMCRFIVGIKFLSRFKP
jgi:hypothetical protein